MCLECSWKTFYHATMHWGKELYKTREMVEDKGRLIRQESKTLEDCTQSCDNENNCHSLGYCPGHKRCYLYDKVLTGNEKAKTKDDCYTKYFHCTGNNLNNQTSHI